jgi:hypothetical protein
LPSSSETQKKKGGKGKKKRKGREKAVVLKQIDRQDIDVSKK